MEAQITELLRRVGTGDESASEELMPLVYSELRRIAQRHLRNERREHTLQATALVNEAYLRIFKRAQPQFADRVHFLALSSRIMRRILVDYARNRATAVHGGEGMPVDAMSEGRLALADGSQPLDLLDVDFAIDELTRENPQVAAVVEMRYFGGMTAEESAEAVGRSVHVVQHQLRFGRAWLKRRLADLSSDTSRGPCPI